MDIKPVLTKLSDSQKCIPKSLQTLTKAHEQPIVRVCKEDALYKKFQEQDRIDNLDN